MCGLAAGSGRPCPSSGGREPGGPWPARTSPAALLISTICRSAVGRGPAARSAEPSSRPRVVHESVRQGPLRAGDGRRDPTPAPNHSRPPGTGHRTARPPRAAPTAGSPARRTSRTARPRGPASPGGARRAAAAAVARVGPPSRRGPVGAAPAGAPRGSPPRPPAPRRRHSIRSCSPQRRSHEGFSVRSRHFRRVEPRCSCAPAARHRLPPVDAASRRSTPPHDTAGGHRAGGHRAGGHRSRTPQ